MLKIRFAPIAAAIKVKNLTPFVSNELLEYAFSIFGDVCCLYNTPKYFYVKIIFNVLD